MLVYAMPHLYPFTPTHKGDSWRNWRPNPIPKFLIKSVQASTKLPGKFFVRKISIMSWKYVNFQNCAILQIYLCRNEWFQVIHSVMSYGYGNVVKMDGCIERRYFVEQSKLKLNEMCFKFFWFLLFSIFTIQYNSLLGKKQLNWKKWKMF